MIGLHVRLSLDLVVRQNSVLVPDVSRRRRDNELVAVFLLLLRGVKVSAFPLSKQVLNVTIDDVGSLLRNVIVL